MIALADRFAIISDIHGNSPALEAVLRDIRTHRCDQLFVLGDVINGFDPRGCLDLLRSWKDAHYLMGNAEEYTLISGLEDFPLRPDPFFSTLVDLLLWFRAKLSLEDLAWIGAWQQVLFIDGLCLVHDSPVDRLNPEKFHRPGIAPQYQAIFHHSKGVHEKADGTEWAHLLACLEERGARSLFCGHTHTAFIRQVNGGVICNAGSVGMPLDHDPRPAWVLVETHKSAGIIQTAAIHRIDYDLDRTLALVDRAEDHPNFTHPGYRKAYQMCLRTGIHWKKFIGTWNPE